MTMQAQATKSSKDEALDLLRAEMERTNGELRDINSKVSQSRGQVEQLAQRNAAVISEVRRIEGALEQTPRMAIKEAYAEALDTQQRLMTLRAQMERLQAEEAAVKRNTEALQELASVLSRREESDDGESFDAREIVVRVIDAQEEERNKLARRMHDGPAHALTNFILQAEICQKLFDKKPEKAREELINLKTAANEAFQKVRGFIFDLSPMMLTDLGLAPTLKRYLEGFAEKTGVETELEPIGNMSRRLERYREVLMFRGIQGLMEHARDHSGASYVKVTLDLSGDRVRAIVEDNGRGFGTGRLSLNASNSETLGLGALQEQSQAGGWHYSC